MTDRPTGATDGSKTIKPTESPTAPRRSRARRIPEERLLLRLLTDPRGKGEDLFPDEVRELRRRLDEEPELAARFERLAAPWRRLEPPPDALPPGLTGRVMARLGEERRSPPPLIGAPVRVRSLATLAVVVGLVAGPLLVERFAETSPDLAPVEIAETLGAGWLDDSQDLAESYLRALETETDGAGADAEARDPGSPERGTKGSTDAGGTR